MKFRKLRIAWSIFCGIACVLLIVLWVRSYTWWDEFYTPTSMARYHSPFLDSRILIVESASGQVLVYYPQGSGPWSWHISSELDGRYWYGADQESADQNRNKGFAGFAIYRTFGLYPTLRVPY